MRLIVTTMLGLLLYLSVENLRRCKQGKGLCLIQTLSDNEDDQDNEYDSMIFTDRNAQNLRRINQRKGLCFIQVVSDDEDDQDENRIAPIAIKISLLKCNHPKQVHLLKPVCRFVSLFSKKSEKYPPQCIQG